MRKFFLLVFLVWFGFFAFAGTLDQFNSSGFPAGGTFGINTLGGSIGIQSFYVSSNVRLTAVQVGIDLNVSDLNVTIFDFNSDGFPRNNLGCIQTPPGDANGGFFPAFVDFNFSLSNNCNLEPDTNYGILLNRDVSNGGNWYFSTASDQYLRGYTFVSVDGGSTWRRGINNLIEDFYFRLFTVPQLNADFSSKKIRDLNVSTDTNAVYDFNSISFYGAGLRDFNWFVDGVRKKTGTSLADVNFHYEGFDAIDDYNVSLLISDVSGMQDQKDLNVNVSEPISGLDINFSVLGYVIDNVDVNFTVNHENVGVNYYVWSGLQDGARLGAKTINADFNLSNVYSVCATVNTVGDVNSQVCEDFILNAILVKRPLSENDLSTVLTPFSVKNSFAGTEFTDRTVDTNVMNFFQSSAETTLTIDFNADYYPRNYFYSLNSGNVFFQLQPYLTFVTDSALVTITVIDGLTNNPISNYRIDIFREINGTELLFESQEVDGSGTGISSMIVGNLYLGKLYDSLNVFVDSKMISPSNTTYIWKVNPQIPELNVSDAVMTVDFSPVPPVIFQLPGDGNKTFAENIETESSLTSANVQILVSDNLIFDINYSVDGNKTQDVNLSGFLNNSVVEVVVTITNPNRTQVFQKNYVLKTDDTFNFISLVRDAKNDLTDIGALLVSLVVAILGTGFIAGFVGLDSIVLIPVLFLFLGFFVYISWFPFLIYLFGIVGSGGLIVLRGYLR